jgi:hypothetical protein
MIKAFCGNVYVDAIFMILEDETDIDASFIDKAITFKTKSGKFGSILPLPLEKDMFEFTYNNKLICNFNSCERDLIAPFKNTDITSYFNGMQVLSNTISYASSNAVKIDKRIYDSIIVIMTNLENNLMKGIFNEMPIVKDAMNNVDYMSPYTGEHRSRIYYNIMYDALDGHKTMDFCSLVN